MAMTKPTGLRYLEPGEVGRFAATHEDGRPCCTLGYWAHQRGIRVGVMNDEHDSAFDNAFESGEELAVALVDSARLMAGHSCVFQNPSECVGGASDGMDDDDRHELYNAALEAIGVKR